MENTIKELQEIINAYAIRLAAISDAEFSARPSDAQWSRKEVLGHLIDSAQNNIRRFICGQYETIPSKIRYDQDFWVSANDYHNRKPIDIILLWKSMNEQIIAILKKMPVENYSKVSDTGRNEVEPHELQWLAADYVKHLKHHINQIIPSSFDTVYITK